MLLFTSYSDWMIDTHRTLTCTELVQRADAVIQLSENTYYKAYNDQDQIVYSNQASNILPEHSVWAASGIVFFPQVLSDEYNWYRWGIMYVANCDGNTTTSACSNTNNCQGPTVLDFNMKVCVVCRVSIFCVCEHILCWSFVLYVH